MPSLQPYAEVAYLETTSGNHEGQGAKGRLQAAPVTRPQIGSGKQLDDTTAEPHGLVNLRGAEDPRHQQDTKPSGLLHELWAPARCHGIAEIQTR